MPSKQRHEYELKFKVSRDLSALPDLRQKLLMAGFSAGPRSIETDYLPDTPSGALKDAKMLLRFRQVEDPTAKALLLTLKIRQADHGVLHFREYETDLSDPNIKVVDTINGLLRKKIGLTLDKSVLKTNSLEQVRGVLKELGFSKHRILLSKYRENFSLGQDNATIDYFPEGMGVYIEFESHTKEALQHSIGRVGFDEALGTDTDYGDLLKQHKVGLEDQTQRTALFSGQELSTVASMMRNGYDS